MNKMEAYEAHPFDVMFVGSDWQGSDTWNQLEQTFAEVGVDIHYLPYTSGTSSTALRSALQRINSKETVK
ncbi:glycerol-3-phosphate cytidylyltransferase [Listeria weihenstephanensis FSL R9-0317]|nr:hypothetical protein [Listeria weihenstephanensis]EUJ35022.1 glycerol-3-phosphate cytidylyltransferase [Listeria weihenstephanensis FSL R9-0317]